MTTYRFGLKPLSSMGDVRVKLKSKFGLKPLAPEVIPEIIEVAPPLPFNDSLFYTINKVPPDGEGSYTFFLQEYGSSPFELLRERDITGNLGAYPNILLMVMDAEFIFILDTSSFVLCKFRRDDFSYLGFVRIAGTFYYSGFPYACGASNPISIAQDEAYLYLNMQYGGRDESGHSNWSNWSGGALMKVTKSLVITDFVEAGLPYLSATPRIMSIAVGRHLIFKLDNTQLRRYWSSDLSFVDTYSSLPGTLGAWAAYGMEIYYYAGSGRMIRFDPYTWEVALDYTNENVSAYDLGVASTGVFLKGLRPDGVKHMITKYDLAQLAFDSVIGEDLPITTTGFGVVPVDSPV